jgi:hypothetical protein
MRTAIASIAALAILAIAPSMVMAKTINNQLTLGQIDSYCSGGAANAGNATFKLGNDKTVSGSVDCTSAGQSSISAASSADDKGMESGNDADSSHED